VQVDFTLMADGARLVLVGPTSRLEFEVGDGYVSIEPSGRYAVTRSLGGGVRVVDLVGGQIHDLGQYSFSREAGWSPEGRYLTIPYVEGRTTRLIAVFDLGGLPTSPPREVGRYRDTLLVDWLRDGSQALLLSEVCLPDGFVLERLALPGGAVTRIPTQRRGSWDHAWSPRGDVIAISAPDNFISLIDAVSGVRRATPNLDRSVAYWQTITGWSASGRWLAFSVQQGRDRCVG
jgi:WD40 repeat protein